jgi:hypothetical protein
MSKNDKRIYISLAIIFVVFSVIAFAVPYFTKNTVFFLAYIFAVIAIAFQVYVYRISSLGNGSAKSRFYGFPIVRVGIIYLVVQGVISIIEIALAAYIPSWITIIINLFPIAFAVIGCMTTEAMRDEIVRQDIVIKKEVGNMRGLQSLSASLASLSQDPELKKVLARLAEEFKYSDPVSSDNTIVMEKELNEQLIELQTAVIDNDNVSAKTLCNKISAALKERNRICKLDK